MDYAELHCISNFTFLRGASHPEELIARAAELGYRALAITDECSLAGVVRAHVAAKDHPIRLLVGSEFRLIDGIRLVLLASCVDGYHQLSRLISHARRQAEKGTYRLDRTDLPGRVDDCLALWIAGDMPSASTAQWFAQTFPGRGWLAVELHQAGDDLTVLARARRLAEFHELPLVAGGGVNMHDADRRALQDTLTAIRLNRPVGELGAALDPNAERHLRAKDRLAELYPQGMLAETVRIAERCQFSLDELRYSYPREIAPEGLTPTAYLRKLVRAGQRTHWPDGTPAEVSVQLEQELGLIGELGYEPYFLTVYDLVRFARQQGILCQGRGSAANSAVCYCLGITAVDPARSNLLFERFMSRERNEPPDIDVDFEHDRREEVIQYIYAKYGRQRAALAATVITYRPRSALRDVGKALGLAPAQLDALAKAMQWWDGRQVSPERIREAGFDPDSRIMRQLMGLVNTLIGFPRHLSQHVGGFVISDDRLDSLVPIENAAMTDRTVIQWDKDDLDALGILKIDVLALGMLSVIRRCFELLDSTYGRQLTLHTLPPEDPAVYRMLQRGDSVGVFQVESRAQMAMLPRLKPKCFYDLVIEVAIVRPGPIQGGMVHPYLARRAGEAEIPHYPDPRVERVLGRTLGVPIFQEQVMQLAVVAAGFTPGEADQLRRSMAAWHRKGGLEPFRDKLIRGMTDRGYEASFAEQIYNQIKGFGEYGFPESHSASFALLVYASAWLKHYYPAAFCAALLDSQPMGFYAPAQLVQDARRHGVAVRPVDVLNSDWETTLESAQESSEVAMRLGFSQVNGLSKTGAKKLLAARDQDAFTRVSELVHRAGLNRRDLEALAAADALSSLAGDRHQARWQATGVVPETPLLTDQTEFADTAVDLPVPTTRDEVYADYASVGLTLREHPIGLLRPRLARRRVTTAVDLRQLSSDRFVRVAGLVINRQRPGSASGVVFMTLEDETGQVNLVVYPSVMERQRAIALRAGLLLVKGNVQREGEVIHVIAGELEDLTPWLGEFTVTSRDFH